MRMAEKDRVEKLLEDYNDVFADIVNVLIFKGERVVQEEELEKTETTSQYKADDSILHEQERDVSKYWKKGGMRIALCGLENQTDIDNNMCLRVINYDGAAYRSQLLERESRDRYPVVTLVLYFGLRSWSGARTLYETVNVPEEMKEFVNDYRINIFEIAYLTDEQLEMFTSDFKIVAEYFVQMRKNKDYVPTPQTIRHVDAVLKFMAVMTGDQRFVKNSIERRREGGITMCEVLDRIEKRGIEKGMERGMEQGIRVLVESCQEFGVTRIQTIKQVSIKFGVTQEEARSFLDKYWMQE